MCLRLGHSRWAGSRWFQNGGSFKGISKGLRLAETCSSYLHPSNASISMGFLSLCAILQIGQTTASQEVQSWWGSLRLWDLVHRAYGIIYMESSLSKHRLNCHRGSLQTVRSNSCKNAKNENVRVKKVLRWSHHISTYLNMSQHSQHKTLGNGDALIFHQLHIRSCKISKIYFMSGIIKVTVTAVFLVVVIIVSSQPSPSSLRWQV